MNTSDRTTNELRKIPIESVWSDSVKGLNKAHPVLNEDHQTEVLVIGAGMAGILTAWRLRQAGMDVTVVEAKTVGSGITRNTTAKITAQHGLIYADIMNRSGIEKAQLYYNINTHAINEFRRLNETYNCDLEDKTAYVYSLNNRSKLEQEATAYERMGKTARIEENPDIPLDTVGALAMSKQAQFNPLKLLTKLADELRIFENTFVKKIEHNYAVTDHGKIHAKHIILATHFPMINIPGLYFLKMYQHRSYVLALEGAPLIDGMYVDENELGNSFRTYQDLLLIGGGDHKTGTSGGDFEELIRLKEKAYPQAKLKFRWATQDCMTLDNIPYIGRHRAGKSSLYVATGFNKWGMTGSMVASEVLSDLIIKGKSKAGQLYSPSRSIWTKQLAVNVGSAAVGLLAVGGPRCTHMGCKLHQNLAEGTWDCSCHGSRFDKTGKLIDNPAKKDKLLQK